MIHSAQRRHYTEIWGALALRQELWALIRHIYTCSLFGCIHIFWVSNSFGLQHLCLYVLGTLNSLGTMSFGVFTPTKASTPQKTRMVKMMAKSLMSFRTWRGGSYLALFPFVTIKSIQKKKLSQWENCRNSPDSAKGPTLTVVGKNWLVLNCFSAMEQA